MGDFLSQTFYGNKLEDWAISFAIILGSVIIAKVLYWAIGKYVKSAAEKTKGNLDDLLVDKLEEPVVYAIVITGFYWGFQRLSFSPEVDSFFSNVFIICYAINFTWMFARVIDSLIVEYVSPLVEKSDSDLDDQLMPIIRKGIRAVIWSLGIIMGLNNAGFDVMALIAGLGIGGLALALAAQDTVKNIFGGIMVFVDKPFKIGQRVKIGGFDGSVEEIGLRSTRLRTLEGRLVTLPNSQFSDNAVENVTLEPGRKVVLSLGLTYETSPEKMEEAIETLRTIATENENVDTERIFIGFTSWGDFSMGITFIYWINPGADILGTQNEMNLRILREFNQRGLDFAYPTQMLYKKEVQ